MRNVSHLRGSYTADRAAALSGVPRRTVHYWAREGILVPSLSPERVKLWSYSDLLALRTIYWLRQIKASAEGHEVPRTSMVAVRRALSYLRELNLELWTEDMRPTVAVDVQGRVYVETESDLSVPGGQSVLEGKWLNLLAPFTTDHTRGPDLREPRPHVRIVPGKLAGSPHVVGTRVETIALAALESRGFDQDRIRQLYPVLPDEGVADALDLERQLRQNLRLAA